MTEVDPFTERMSHALRDTDAFAAELRQQMEDSIRPVAERVIADAVRPWKHAMFWLGLAYVALLVLSVVQWLQS